MHLFQSDVSIPAAIGYSILGMAIVFAVLIVVMLVIKIMERFSGEKKETAPESPAAAPASPAAASAAPAPAAKPAPGTAGQLKLYNVDERDAAMVMAIVADSLGKPLNELRFISIREVTDQ